MLFGMFVFYVFLYRVFGRLSFDISLAASADLAPKAKQWVRHKAIGIRSQNSHRLQMHSTRSAQHNIPCDFDVTHIEFERPTQRDMVVLSIPSRRASRATEWRSVGTRSLTDDK